MLKSQADLSNEEKPCAESSSKRKKPHIKSFLGKKKKSQNMSMFYDSEYFPEEARKEKKEVKRSFSFTTMRTPSLENLPDAFVKKFHTLGRKSRKLFSLDNDSLSSYSISAPFSQPAPVMEFDNKRIKIGQSTFYILSDEASHTEELNNFSREAPTNSHTGNKADKEDELFLNPLETNESESDLGSDIVDGDFVEALSEGSLVSVNSDGDTDYFSFESCNSIQSEGARSEVLVRHSRSRSKSLDDMSMLRTKKNKFSLSNENINKNGLDSFPSVEAGVTSLPVTLSSSHPHLFSPDNSRYSLKNNSHNHSAWRPFRKLKNIFKSSTKLTEADVYNDTYHHHHHLQNKPTQQINQNPIYIASPEEELQEVTGFPNHQAPFYRQSLGIVLRTFVNAMLVVFS